MDPSLWSNMFQLAWDSITFDQEALTILGTNCWLLFKSSFSLFIMSPPR